MFRKVKILDEKDKRLRTKSVPFTEPVSDEEKKLVERMITHLTYSQIPEYEEKYDLRPGMGLAFPQVVLIRDLLLLLMNMKKESSKIISLLILKLLVILRKKSQLMLVKVV